MNADSFFWIGKTHKVCEDYALSGHVNDQPYAIVCDGCSSSPDTDFGARVLSKSAERAIQFALLSSPEPSSVIKPFEIISLAQSNTEGWSPYCLDSTLLMAFVKDNNVYVRCYGDGVITFINNENEITSFVIDYESGAPYYLNYLLDSKRKEIYLASTGSLRSGNLGYSLEKIPVSSKHAHVPIFGDYSIPSDHFCITAAINDLKAVLLTSDGLSSFTELSIGETSKIQEQISLEEVARELFAFKNYNGVFIQRRVQRFIQDITERHWQNNDDVSIAGIYLGN